jgi:hypothetical protein
LLLFFSTIPFTPLTSIYVHYAMLPFPLLFSMVLKLHSLHSCYYELHKFENAQNFQQQTKIAFDNYFIFLIY